MFRFLGIFSLGFMITVVIGLMMNNGVIVTENIVRFFIGCGIGALIYFLIIEPILIKISKKD